MKYFLKKIGMFVFTLFISVSINFFLPRLMPGDPAEALMDKMGGIPPEQLESIRVAFGLATTDSLFVQYGKYLLNTLQGDFGISLSRFPMPVLSVLKIALPWTIGLIGLCTLISFTLGTLIGIAAAWRRET
ncbi:MAG: ABC transporter permease, partial [Spirochaetota bacterium]